MGNNANDPLLPVTPRPHTREAFLGHLLRVSEDNGYPTPEWILTVAGLSEKERRRCHVPLGKVAPVLNRSPEEFKYNAWAPASVSGHDSASLRGHSFLARSLCLQHPKVCPECIEEKGFIRASWDIGFMVGCPRHNRLLVWSCPECGKRLGWKRQGQLICTCGGDMRTAPRVEMSASLVELLTFIERRFYGDDTKVLYPKRRLPLYNLEKLSLQALITLVEILGKCSLGLTGRNRNRGEAIDPEWYARVAGSGAQILADWPENFYAFLDRLYGASNPGDLAVDEFDEILHKNSGHKQFYSFVRLSMAEWRKQHRHYGLKVITPAASIAISDDKLLSLRQFSILTGADVRAIRKAILAGVLKAKCFTMTGAVRYMIDLNETPEEYVKNAHRTLNRREASQFLGLPEESISLLTKHGILKRKYMPVPAQCHRHEDLQAFQKQMLDLCPSMDGADFDARIHIKLSDVILKKQGKGVRRAAIVEEIYRGTLCPVGRIGESLREIVLLKSDIKARQIKCRIPTG